MARRANEGQEEIDSHSDVGLVNIFSQSKYHLKTVEPTADVPQCFVNTKYLWLKHFTDGNGSDRLCVPMQTTISWLYANWVGQWPTNWWFWQNLTNILTNSFFSRSIHIHCQEVAQELNQRNSSNVVWGTCNHLFAEARALRHWDSQVMERI